MSSSPIFSSSLFFELHRSPHTSPHLPYTTLFRSPMEAAMAVQPGRELERARRSEIVRPAIPTHDEINRTWRLAEALAMRDRKSTRLNSSHRCISYAVFCLKKKK